MLQFIVDNRREVNKETSISNNESNYEIPKGFLKEKI